MAKTVVNLTDPLSTLVTKINQISNDLGDIQSVHFYDSSVAGMLIQVDSAADSTNNIAVRSSLSTGTPQNLDYDSASGQFSLLFDSSQARKVISVTSSGAGSLAYNSGTGVLAYTGPATTNVVGDTTPQLGGNLDVNGKNINFGDASSPGSDDTLQFGASSDLKIYHDTSNSYINETGTGSLIIKGSIIKFESSVDTAYMINAAAAGAVNLYYNGGNRLETTASGVTVTGTLSATGFSGPLTGNVTGNASGSSGSCTGNAATATALQNTRTIGGVSFNGTGNINLPGVNTAGNQNTTGSAAKLTTARSIGLSGDVAGSANFDGSGNITISTTIQGNSVALGTDTTGDYVYRIASGTGVTVSSTSGEGAHPTISIAQSVGTSDHVRFHCLGLGTNASGNTGELRATGNITAYYSDERLKDMHGKIEGALDKVESINGYYYKENEKAKELGYDNDKMQVGVSAQEIEKILPEVVTGAPIADEIEEDYKTVYYDKLVPLLIEAIKELNQKVKDLENK